MYHSLPMVMKEVYNHEGLKNKLNKWLRNRVGEVSFRVENTQTKWRLHITHHHSHQSSLSLIALGKQPHCKNAMAFDCMSKQLRD